MNKQKVTVLIGIIVVTALAGFFLTKTLVGTSYYVPPKENVIAPADYPSLEKDRLYTEKEGKYANLSTTGQNLLRSVLIPARCIGDPSGNYCSDYEWTTAHSSIISLQKGVLLFDYVGVKGDRYYEFYDVTRKKMLGKPLAYYSSVRSDNFVIYVDDYSNSNEQTIRYYKIGMSQFSTVPNSTIYSNESYLYPIGMGFMDAKWSIVGNFLKISVYRKQPTIDSPWPKLREVTFDLGALP